jgi:hypothetical protein
MAAITLIVCVLKITTCIVIDSAFSHIVCVIYGPDYYWRRWLCWLTRLFPFEMQLNYVNSKLLWKCMFWKTKWQERLWYNRCLLTGLKLTPAEFLWNAGAALISSYLFLIRLSLWYFLSRVWEIFHCPVACKFRWDLPLRYKWKCVLCVMFPPHLGT